MSGRDERGGKTLVDYRARGLAGRIGCGRSPAIIVVDLILGFTRTTSPLGSELDGVVAATRKLLAAGRAAAVPIVFTTTAYAPDLADAGLFPRKVPSLAILRQGSDWVAVDERLGRRPEETLIEKKYASAFFGTALASQLVARGVDTVLVCGATTSGCVRATVVDALQHGFRPIVPEACVGDRSVDAHRANLTDIEGKYGDVVSLDEACGYLVDGWGSHA